MNHVLMLLKVNEFLARVDVTQTLEYQMLQYHMVNFHNENDRARFIQICRILYYKQPI